MHNDAEGLLLLLVLKLKKIVEFAFHIIEISGMYILLDVEILVLAFKFCKKRNSMLGFQLYYLGFCKALRFTLIEATSKGLVR